MKDKNMEIKEIDLVVISGVFGIVLIVSVLLGLYFFL